MRLQSIFVGQPIKTDYNGKKVATGIYKKAIEGPVQVSKVNLDGDEQSDLTVHGGLDKAVYAYPSEHYDYWKKQRGDLHFEPGLFGENLSTIGLDETTTCIGDVYKTGTVTLSVTTPRMPCFKLGIRMKDPGFVVEFMKAEKNGFYLKVIEEGIVQSGNVIEKAHSDGYGLSVKETIQLYTTRKSDRDLLKKAIASPSLPKDWVDHFEVQLRQLS